MLRKSLLRAGFSRDDIRKLLNGPIGAEHPCLPFVLASRNKYDVLAARLVFDGAEPTEEHQEQVRQMRQKREEAENRKAPVDRSDIEESLQQPSRLRWGSSSLYDDALFAKKQPTRPKGTVDDTVFVQKKHCHLPRSFF